MFKKLGLLVLFFGSAWTAHAADAWLKVGERALNVERESVRVKVIAIEADGDYVIRFEEGMLRGQVGGGWKSSSLARLSGCGIGDYCTDEVVFNVERDAAYARIIGLSEDGTYVLAFLDGILYGQRGGGWPAESLASTEGCGKNFCVGDYAYHTERDYALVRVVGIQTAADMTKTYVVLFRNGILAGMRGAGWGDEALAKIERK